MVKKITLSKTNEPNDEAPSHEGFEITKEEMAGYSKSMTRYNASVFRMWLTKSKKIMNRDLVLVMYDPSMLTLTQKVALWVFRKLFI